MQTNTSSSIGAKAKKHSINFLSYGLLMGCCIFVAVLTYILYKQTQVILEDRLKERLTAIVSTAALHYSTAELEMIDGAEAVGSEEYRSIVYKLQLLRNTNKNITYAYIFRQTADPDRFIYLADADSLNPSAEIDLNLDGIINEEDALNTPGDEYDVSEIPALRDEAIIFPTTDAEPVGDQWGLFLSAYAPIKERGQTVAILGIDVEVSDYLQLISRTFVPFSFFIVFLLLLLTLMTVELVKIWNKKVEAVQELDLQKDELLGIVSHQLATPVTSVKWYVEMMIDGEVGKITQEQKKHLTDVQGVTNNLSDLVSMILDVSRIQLGRMKTDPQELDLNEFFKEILVVIEPKAKEKGVKFNYALPANLPVVLLDKRLTRMTVENLLTNAVKYTPQDGTVEMKVELHPGNILYCQVKDTGYGIPKKDQGKIFGKLYRASNVRNTVEGNGFGLYVAKGAIEGQGGKIWFDSLEGKGTTFFIQLPLKLKS
jgi:signal transduction histidine kinase